MGPALSAKWPVSCQCGFRRATRKSRRPLKVFSQNSARCLTSLTWNIRTSVFRCSTFLITCLPSYWGRVLPRPVRQTSSKRTGDTLLTQKTASASRSRGRANHLRAALTGRQVALTSAHATSNTTLRALWKWPLCWMTVLRHSAMRKSRSCSGRRQVT